MEERAENVNQKLVPCLYSILVNSPKYSQCIPENLFKGGSLKEDYQKS